MFYYYTAKKQQTNIIKCSTDCVVKCLNWAKCKVVRNKKVLIKKGLVNDVRVKNKKGQITGWYIKLDYI